MTTVSGKCIAYILLDAISEAISVPMLLIDSLGNPLYRSRYYFLADLSQDSTTQLRKALAAAGDEERQRIRQVTVMGLDAIVAPVSGHGQARYLVAGYFVHPGSQAAVLQCFGPELGGELVSKNLSPRWQDKKSVLQEIVTGMAHFMANDLRITNLTRLMTALTARAGFGSERYWQDIFEALHQSFPLSWAAAVFFNDGGSIMARTAQGKTFSRAPFCCPLSDWVRTAGSDARIDNLAGDLRGDRLLALFPQTKALLSIPFPAGAGCYGVLHLASQSPLCSLDTMLLQKVGELLAEQDRAGAKVVPNRLDSATDAIMKLLSGMRHSQSPYTMLLTILVKALQCRSAAVFLCGASGEFIAAASFQLDNNELARDLSRLRQVYSEDGGVMRGVPTGPQGGGYWETPVYIGNKLTAVLVLRGCRFAESEAAYFVQRVAQMLSCFLARRQALELAETLRQDLVESLLLLQERHLPALRSHAERTADLAGTLAQAAGLDEDAVRQVFTASLLHNLGKVSQLPEAGLQSQKRLQGKDVLAALPSLADVAVVLSQLEENVDGSGCPAGLCEEQIHPHTRIIRTAALYVSMVTAPPCGRGLTPAEAIAALAGAAGVEISREYYNLLKTIVTDGLEGHGEAGGEPLDERLKLLTPRELEVLTMIAAGNTNARIAQALVISEKTVKIHVSNLLHKLGAHDRTQAAIYYLTHNAAAKQ